jgi:hypothetical protein
VLDWNKDTFFIKDGPMATVDLVNLLLEVRVKMQEVHVLPYDCFVLLWNKQRAIERVYWSV